MVKHSHFRHIIPPSMYTTLSLLPTEKPATIGSLPLGRSSLWFWLHCHGRCRRRTHKVLRALTTELTDLAIQVVLPLHGQPLRPDDRRQSLGERALPDHNILCRTVRVVSNHQGVRSISCRWAVTAGQVSCGSGRRENRLSHSTAPRAGRPACRQAGTCCTHLMSCTHSGCPPATK